MAGLMSLAALAEALATASAAVGGAAAALQQWVEGARAKSEAAAAPILVAFSASA
jgi:hypothetical protein